MPSEFGWSGAQDAEQAEVLRAMNGALDKIEHNVSQIARRMNDAKYRSKGFPSARPIMLRSGIWQEMVLDFADEDPLIADDRPSTQYIKTSDELQKLPKYGVLARSAVRNRPAPQLQCGSARVRS